MPTYPELDGPVEVCITADDQTSRNMFVTTGTKQESRVANKATGILCCIAKGYECCSFTKKLERENCFTVFMSGLMRTFMV